MAVLNYFHDFGSLFFPSYCSGCTAPLQRGEESICTRCLIRLPKTRLHDYPDNRIERLFWGRADIQFATAFLHMPRSGITHHMIHELKYHGNRQVGVVLGKLFGQDLQRSQRMSTFDRILPIPLHPKKEHQRGYNQCHAICEGLEESLGVPWSRSHLVRDSFSESQTRKSRFERWTNMDSIFAINHSEELEHQHILLIDDVITTGATIEACCHALSSIRGIGISVAALALPVH